MESEQNSRSVHTREFKVEAVKLAWVLGYVAHPRHL